MHHFSHLLLGSALLAGSAAHAECPLEGIWRTDIERSAKTVWASTAIDEKKKQPIISILDEFEWQFTCDTWVVRHVGDHKFPSPVPDESHTYVVERISDSQLKVTLTDSVEPTQQVLTIDESGCIALYDSVREMTEFVCRVK